ncbi:hypothetical protein [Nocardia sp. NPDC057227]|uniref:hypothetical protein n=1 Tax=Nocardia sp. NPDC057227 TaxID=3346056 RepID=UPI0036447E35
MPEPTNAELVGSVIAAGREMRLDITVDSSGAVWISGRRGVAVEPPVEVRFTVESLERYYLDIANDAGRGQISPWDWWCTLMSTHLYEALYQLDRISGRAVVVIERTGFAARSADAS